MRGTTYATTAPTGRRHSLCRVIDLHTHVLPGLDDGPADLAGAVALARAAERAGTEVLVATPHISSEYAVDPLDVPGRVAALRAELARAGVGVEIATGGELAPERAPELERAAMRRDPAWAAATGCCSSALRARLGASSSWSPSGSGPRASAWCSRTRSARPSSCGGGAARRARRARRAGPADRRLAARRLRSDGAGVLLRAARARARPRRRVRCPRHAARPPDARGAVAAAARDRARAAPRSGLAYARRAGCPPRRRATAGPPGAGGGERRSAAPLVVHALKSRSWNPDHWTDVRRGAAARLQAYRRGKDGMLGREAGRGTEAIRDGNRCGTRGKELRRRQRSGACRCRWSPLAARLGRRRPRPPRRCRPGFSETTVVDRPRRRRPRCASHRTAASSLPRKRASSRSSTACRTRRRAGGRRPADEGHGLRRPRAARPGDAAGLPGVGPVDLRLLLARRADRRHPACL